MPNKKAPSPRPGRPLTGREKRQAIEVTLAPEDIALARQISPDKTVSRGIELALSAIRAAAARPMR